MRFQSLLLLPEICWMGETSVFSQATAFPRAAAHSIFLVMDCGRSSVPIPLDLPSAFDALDQEIFFFSDIFGSQWVWRDLLPPHFWEALGVAWRVSTCPGANAGRAGMLLKKEVVSPALLLWPLHSSLAVFIFRPPHFSWHWFDPKRYTLKQECYAAPDRPFCLQSLLLAQSCFHTDTVLTDSFSALNSY